MRRDPPPDREEELALIARAQAGDLEARNSLVIRHFGLIYAACIRQSRRFGGEASDFLGIAAEGFISSIEKFKPELGFRLSTLAGITMDRRICKEAYESQGVIRVPNLYSCPTSLAKQNKALAPLVRAARKRPLSTDLRDQEDDLTIGELIPMREDEDDGGEVPEWSVVVAAIEKLPERFKTFVNLRLTGMSIPEAGVVMGMKPSTAKGVGRMSKLRLRSILIHSRVTPCPSQNSFAAPSSSPKPEAS